MTPQELKNSILQRAIQGKLVEQRPEEGTAEELFQQIQAEKQALIKAGKIKKEKPLPEITDDEKPFDIPESWKWVRLGDAFSIEMGQSPDGNSVSEFHDGMEFHQGKVFFGEKILRQSPQKTSMPTKIAPPNSVLLCVRAPVGKVNITDREICIGRGLCSVATMADVPFNFIYYLLATYERTFIKQATGTTFVAITGAVVKNQIIPLPPLAEQKRIVAKIEELLPLIDRYEAAWSRLEAFNKRFPGDMQKSLLQMAIQGKLVEQRPEEGTGEELFLQIQAEKQALIKAGKIKKDKPLPEIAEDEKPFDIPESWKWVRLSEIGDLNRGKSKHRPRNDPSLFSDGIYPFIQTGDVAQANYHISTWKTMYNEKGLAQSRMWPAGTLCLTIAANIGDVAILDFDACFPDSVVGFLPYGGLCSVYFMLFGLMCYKDILDRMSRSTAQKNINLDILASVAFPLPPLAEQKRIVAKLEALLPLCERLK